MSLNCNEINVILSELKLDGNFIQDVIQPGYDMLALCVYAGGAARTVLICTAQNVCRLHETRRKVVRNDKPLRFMEFLRSNIRGSWIDSCRQIGLQRIVELRLSHGGRSFVMYIRLWSNAANVVVCTPDNVILDSMYRRPARNEVTGARFSLPEPDGAPLREWPVRDFADVQAEYAAAHPDAAPLTFNEKVDRWYGERAAALSREALLKQAEKWYAASKNRQTAALERLEAKRRDFASAGRYRRYGDLILTYPRLLDGTSRFIECEDYEGGGVVRIAVDPAKSAQENAADYYGRYKKARSGADDLQNDIERARRQLAQLESRYQEILDERNPVRIEQLLRRNSTPKQLQKKGHPGLDFTVNGWYILVGRDADENDELLRRHVRGSDWWLHVRDVPGGYVFIKNRPGKTVPLDILLDAANLAVHYSKARNAGKVDLYYTQVKHLRRAKNGPKGLVLPTNEKNICIEPDKRRLARLESGG
ncbi:MAG: NFACT family protein [Treponemataceae bacterium]|nr:NFACT family protein [Treponemataceae bacterium]